MSQRPRASPQLESGVLGSPVEVALPPKSEDLASISAKRQTGARCPSLTSHAEIATNYNPLHIRNSLHVRINLQQKAHEYFAGIKNCLCEAHPTLGKN